ncbi:MULTISPECIES: hypothetical protein [Nannocystis]|uniref:hypothetical protein n=1 Tax=Nannocystis TaxID=53 RepID=UPI0011601B8B|nr:MULTISPECIES: hypothetical protein [Nannocystis]MCY0986460.1 hypothetical protein [Nannocystis sp. ILAH1]MCY0990435.1 hypothetical protein [Nannocystis sp. ILAH1]MCY0994592.1 hypothetical protein [Nannocystis sp. ILAH1]
MINVWPLQRLSQHDDSTVVRDSGVEATGAAGFGASTAAWRVQPTASAITCAIFPIRIVEHYHARPLGIPDRERSQAVARDPGRTSERQY